MRSGRQSLLQAGFLQSVEVGQPFRFWIGPLDCGLDSLENSNLVEAASINTKEAGGIQKDVRTSASFKASLFRSLRAKALVAFFTLREEKSRMFFAIPALTNTFSAL